MTSQGLNFSCITSTLWCLIDVPPLLIKFWFLFPPRTFLFQPPGYLIFRKIPPKTKDMCTTNKKTFLLTFTKQIFLFLFFYWSHTMYFLYIRTILSLLRTLCRVSRVLKGSNVTNTKSNVVFHKQKHKRKYCVHFLLLLT